MRNQNSRLVSESDRTLTMQEQTILDDYLHLTPENQQKVTAYLAVLAASQCTPLPLPCSQR